MEFKYKLSIVIKEFLIDCELEEINIGCSDSQVIKITKNNKFTDNYLSKVDKKFLF